MKLKSGLVVEELPDGGCLIVDESMQQSHSLSPEAAAVWRSLGEGAGDVEALAQATRLQPEIVAAALSQLEQAGLLTADAAGSSRREWLARAATVAGAAVGLKLIETIATPSPAAAQSLIDGGDTQSDGQTGG